MALGKESGQLGRRAVLVHSFHLWSCPSDRQLSCAYFVLHTVTRDAHLSRWTLLIPSHSGLSSLLLNPGHTRLAHYWTVTCLQLEEKKCLHQVNQPWVIGTGDTCHVRHTSPMEKKFKFSLEMGTFRPQKGSAFRVYIFSSFLYSYQLFSHWESTLYFKLIALWLIG